MEHQKSGTIHDASWGILFSTIVMGLCLLSIAEVICATAITLSKGPITIEIKRENTIVDYPLPILKE